MPNADQRQVQAFFLIVLLLSIAFHTHLLYTFLSPAEKMGQVLLRFGLLISPILYPYVSRLSLPTLFQTLLKGFLIVFLPYTLYNLFQLRHLAELFRLPANQYFLPTYVDQSWQIIPTFIYCVFGMILFFYALDLILEGVRQKKLRAFFLIVYAACGAVFGLETRINVYALPFNSLFQEIKQVCIQPGFVVNVLALTITASILYGLWENVGGTLK